MLFASRITSIRRQEKGSSIVEYAGAVLVVALLVASVLLAIPNWGETIACEITSSVARAFGISWTCDATERNKENPHKPTKACTRNSRSRTASFSGAAEISIEANGGIVVEAMSDGTYRVTDKRGGKVGAGTGAGGGVEITWDGQSVGEYKAASIGGKGSGEAGATYTVKSEKEKDDLVGYLTRNATLGSAGLVGAGVNYVWNQFDGYDPPKPSEYYVELGGGGSASADSTGLLNSNSAEGGVSGALGMRVNTEAGTTTVYYKVNGNARGQTRVAGAGQGEAEGSAGYMIAVTKSSDDNKTLNVSLSGNYDGQIGASSPLSVGANKNEGGQVYNASVDLNSAETTSVANDLLRAAGIPTDSPASSSPEALDSALDTFVNASADHGILTRQDINKDTSRYGAKFDVKALLEASLGAAYTDETVTYSNGQYYDGTQWQTWAGCQ